MQIVKSLLQFLNDTLDPAKQQQTENSHHRALNWETVERLPLVVTYPYPKSKPYQPFPHREVFDHPEKMLFNELVYAFDSCILLHSELNDDLSFTIRANFGTIVIASLFGGLVEQRDDNPPWIRHFETLDEFKTILKKTLVIFLRGFALKLSRGISFTTRFWLIIPICRNV